MPFPHDHHGDDDDHDKNDDNSPARDESAILTLTKKNKTATDAPKIGPSCIYVVELLHTNIANNVMLHDDVISPPPTDITTNVGTRLLFQNESIKVWDFRIGVGQTSHVHCHVHNYLFVNLVRSKSQGVSETGDLLMMGGPPSIQEAGQITYVNVRMPVLLQQQQRSPPANEDHHQSSSTGSVASYPIHAARNCGEDEFQQIIVEFL